MKYSLEELTVMIAEANEAMDEAEERVMELGREAAVGAYDWSDVYAAEHEALDLRRHALTLQIEMCSRIAKAMARLGVNYPDAAAECIFMREYDFNVERGYWCGQASMDLV
jgi:hypothetical protein